jgi:glucose-1-phosphate thymidylyltransferase
MAVVGVIPAAGSAIRLQPLQSSKEVLPVQGRPVMDYLVERLRCARCDEIRLVTRADKEDVIERARDLGLRVVRANPETAAESVALGLVGLAPGDLVLVGFPDSIWEPADGFVRLIADLDEDVAAILGLFRTPELERSDVVSLDVNRRVTAVDVKPARPASEWIWGCAAAHAAALANMGRARDIGRHFDALARRDLVRGVQLSDSWVDVGTRAGLQRALGTQRVDADRQTQVVR